MNKEEQEYADKDYTIKRLFEANKDLSNRISKAIEYINTNLQQTEKEIEYCIDKDIIDSFIGKIERILKGEDNDQI